MLSPSRLKTQSLMTVENEADSIKRFASSHTFTIYEGDWGKPYAARFEVWYKPDTSDKEEKLFTKNYIIEGWQH